VSFSRRGFLVSAAGLAAAVVSSNLAALPEDGPENMEWHLKGRTVIRNQTFVFTEKGRATLRDLKDITFIDCRFEWKNATPGLGILIKDCENLSIIGCHLELWYEQPKLALWQGWAEQQEWTTYDDLYLS